MIIKEFLPNPSGKDIEGEYVTLTNTSDSIVSLSGWHIRDAAGKKYVLSGTLKPGEDQTLTYNQTKIPLNNSGETVFLYSAEGTLVDSLSYVGQAAEGLIINQSQAEDGLYKRQEVLEGSALLSGAINIQSSKAELFSTMFLAAAIFASLSVYAYREFTRDPSIR